MRVQRGEIREKWGENAINRLVSKHDRRTINDYIIQIFTYVRIRLYTTL